MWPTALQLTRDECRGILRRLELESYSNVISAFRAQGNLSDSKMKILEDLRNVFHISQDRHRAEARRAANDEQLSTIADSLIGPNTYQEWSREGRRSFPLLPRTAPQTAVSSIANNVAEQVTKENSSLPYPCETERSAEEVENVETANKPVVLEDPHLPTPSTSTKLERKSLKRVLIECTTVPNKKRITESGNDDESTLVSAASQDELMEATNTHIHQLYHNHSKTQSVKQKKTPVKKSPSAKRTNATATRAPKPIKDIIEILKSENNNTTPNEPEFTYPAAQLCPPQDASPPLPEDHTTNSFTSPDKIPQIATSKKDISNNLNKLKKIRPTYCPPRTTPVQKYIVEERPPPIDMKQISKVKAITTTPPTGTTPNTIKIQPLKTVSVGQSSPAALSTSPHIFNVVETVPPSIINLNNTKVETEPKLLSTKTVPIAGKATGSDFLANNGKDSKTTIVPNIAKSSVQTFTPLKAQKIQLNNSSIVRNIKLPSGMQLKNLQNRKSVNIFSSSNGKMFIQSGDSVKPIAKLNPLMTQKVSNSLPSPSSTTPTGRISFPKVQIIKSPTIANSSNKTISISKSNMVYVQNINSSSQPSTGAGKSAISTASAKTLPIVKTNKLIPVLPMSNAELSPTSSYKSALSPKGQNVFVIGSMPTASGTTNQFDDSNMITEDTPVDILNTPIIVAEDDGNVKTSRSLESKKIEILEDISIVSNIKLNRLTSSTTTHDGAAKISDVTNSSIIDVTDWEMELDQEANKSRAVSSQRSCDDQPLEEGECEDSNLIQEINEFNASTIQEDNYNEVIEEDGIDGDDDQQNRTADVIEFNESYESTNDEMDDDNIAIEYVEDIQEIYEQEKKAAASSANEYSDECHDYDDHEIEKEPIIDVVNSDSPSSRQWQFTIQNSTSNQAVSTDETAAVDMNVQNVI